MRDDEELPKKKPGHVVGEDLAALSLDELAARIDLLRAEIVRIEAAVSEKRASREAAASFFRR